MISPIAVLSLILGSRYQFASISTIVIAPTNFSNLLSTVSAYASFLFPVNAAGQNFQSHSHPFILYFSSLLCSGFFDLAFHTLPFFQYPSFLRLRFAGDKPPQIIR